MENVVQNRLLMCAPDAYDLRYEINAWMSLDDRPNLVLARKQWDLLYQTLTQEVGAKVDLIPQQLDAPDMVFTANAGFVDRNNGNRILLSHFRNPERQVEEPAFRSWFDARGYQCLKPPKDCHFEGEGDLLPAGDLLVAGYLKRSDISAHRWVSEVLGQTVLSVELVDGRWYHLDTAFFALKDRLVAMVPSAFDEYAQRVIHEHFDVIEVSKEEALRFGCNAIVIGKDVIMPDGCPILSRRLETMGMRVHSVSLSEFIKSGGAAKCLVLHI